MIVDELISFFADAPGLDHRMSAIAGMNPPPSLQVIYVLLISKKRCKHKDNHKDKYKYADICKYIINPPLSIDLVVTVSTHM